MPIHHLLYRCPRCGHDPTTATSRGARCDSCGATFEQGRGGVILLRSSDGQVEAARVGALMDALDRLSGETPIPGAPVPEGTVYHEARVVASCGNRHDAVWWKGRVLGFFERLRDRREAILRLDGRGVTVTSPGREPLVWGLESIMAVQISSNAIQLNVRDSGLHQMEFPDDSPKRWDDLMKVALRRFYEARDREVLEFKPQIITRARS